MIVLAEKGISEYGNKLISFSKNEQKSDEILKLNPRGQVPTFRDGDVVVNESTAICEYLEFKFAEQGATLLPSDAATRGRVLQRMFETQNLMKTLIEGVAYLFFHNKPEEINQDELNAKKKAARTELERWEEYLKAEGTDSYIVGSQFTMADVFLFPLLAFGVRGNLNLSSFPAINAYYQRLEQRPSIQETWPPHWKEGPGTDFCSGI
ncbi:hypothetical protein C0Q70_07326 [Pomacea canaliculata]|uniref:Glutathione S-transferase n=2 Tax=Pomacea canaliculata TaxID=400727 RepID=A0A2T7PER2_POMCA|nr:hypothetical protein C0Q70_07326 [Pomacea canaliculata]